MRRDFDSAAKLLFVGGVVADALLELEPRLAALLDLGSIRALPAEYVGRGAPGRRGKRFGDAAFRVDFKAGAPGAPPYLLLAAEFQHRSDGNMAGRVREYADWQDAHYRRLGVIGEGEHPPILALVFHTGADRWTAADGTEVYAGLPGDAAERLARWQRQAYIPVETGPRSTLEPPPGSRFGAVLRLVGASREQLPARLAEAVARFPGAAHAHLREGLLAWAEEMLLGSPESGARLPSLEELEGKSEKEMSYVFEEYVNELKAEGRLEGRQEGRLEGRQEGRQEGQRELLADMAERRFGGDAGRRLSQTLNGTPSAERMAEVSDLILRCDTARDFIDRLDG